MFGDELLNIACLTESQDLIDPISGDGHAEVILALA